MKGLTASPYRRTHLGADPETPRFWELRNPSELGQISHQETVYTVPTVYQATHTQPLPAFSLAKPAHPACWDKFPGGQYSL